MKQKLSRQAFFGWLPLAVGCFWLVVYLWQVPMRWLMDPDVLWHLAAGRMASPREDGLRFTAAGYDWLNLSVGWDAMIYQLWQWGGWKAMQLLAALLAVAVPCGTTWLLLRRGDGVLLAVLGGMLAGVLISQAVSLRPQLVGLVMLLALSAMLLRQGAGWNVRKALAICVLLPLWGLSHGSVALGVLLLGLTAVCWALAGRWRDGWQLATITVAAVVLMLAIHPLGMDMVEAIHRTLNSQLATHLKEWQPLDPTREIFPAIWLVAVCWAAVAHLRGRNFVEAVTLILSALLAWTAIRHIPLMGVLTVLAVMQAVALPAFLAGKNAEYTADWQRLSPKATAGLAGMALGFMLLASVWMPAPPPSQHERAIHWLTKRYSHARLWNDYNLGGAILWWGEGKLQLAMDGRAETAYPSDVASHAIGFWKGDIPWVVIASLYRPDLLILPASHPLIPMLEHQQMREIYNDGMTSIWKHP